MSEQQEGRAFVPSRAADTAASDEENDGNDDDRRSSSTRRERQQENGEGEDAERNRNDDGDVLPPSGNTTTAVLLEPPPPPPPRPVRYFEFPPGAGEDFFRALSFFTNSNNDNAHTNEGNGSGGRGGGGQQQPSSSSSLPGPVHPLYSPQRLLQSSLSSQSVRRRRRRRRQGAASAAVGGRRRQQQQVSTNGSWPPTAPVHSWRTAEDVGKVGFGDDDFLEELAVMELPDVVVFPGDTLPLRVCDPSWASFLGRQIDRARNEPGRLLSDDDDDDRDGQIRFGVLTRPERHRHRQPSFRARGVPIGAAGIFFGRTGDREDDAEEEDDEEEEEDRARTRRQSWTRRGVGPRRLTAFSQRLIQELGDMDDLSRDEDSNGDHDDVSPPSENREEDGSGGGGHESGDRGIAGGGEEQPRQQPVAGAADGGQETNHRRVRPRWIASALSSFRRSGDRGDEREDGERGESQAADNENEFQINRDNSEDRSSMSVDGSERASRRGATVNSVGEAQVAADGNDSGDNGIPLAERDIGGVPNEDDTSSDGSMPALDAPDANDASSNGSISELPPLIARYEDDSSSDESMPAENNGSRAPIPAPLARLVLDVVLPAQRNILSTIDGGRGNPDLMYLGRIGTIVSVIYTHGDAATEGTSVWRSHDRGQVVITCLAVNRFRIVSLSSEEGRIKKFLVEEIYDEPLHLPPDLPNTCRFVDLKGGKCSLETARQRQLARSVSLVTPVPYFVYKRTWPWSLAASIRDDLERIPSFAGVLESLPSEDDAIDGEKARRLADPLYFSYWLASNLPLGKDEKLRLLALMSTTERLLRLKEKILKAEEAESVIQCRVCGCPLTRASNMFSVGGAEGSTGNYVNEYGHVHQTITVRELDEDEVRLQGRPETRDTWFPGYSWTIMNCAFCRAHLGWKFQIVDVDVGAAVTPQRPAFFYGLTAGSVKTIVPETRRPRRTRRA